SLAYRMCVGYHVDGFVDDPAATADLHSLSLPTLFRSVLAGGGSGGEPGAGSGGAAGADSRGDAGAGSNGNAGADSVAAAGAPSMIPVCAPPLVNLNTASVEELTRIVHVGPVLAARIVEARPF